MADCKRFAVAGAYDTETTNIIRYKESGELESARAFPVLFIYNDLTGTRLRTYTPDDGTVSFYRYASDFIDRLVDVVDWGHKTGNIPVICAYNLMFDMQPIIYRLNQLYDMQCAAQSSTHVYTLDLLDDDGNIQLRFWDTYFLEMRGLAAMGEVCGLAKATGDWDYTLVRTPETPLTPDELHYAARDVQVIPAYLRYLLEANEWLKPDMLGCQVLTKTSLVRQMARREIGRLRYKPKTGEPKTTLYMFQALCKRESARDYASYALRKSCFRGGFTFTAARYASQVQRHVYSLDETSAHHAFINGHKVPVRFREMRADIIERAANKIINVSRETLLTRYEEPFGVAIHACIAFENIRLKRGSCFDAWKIGLLAESKFRGVGQRTYGGEPETASESSIRERGYLDQAANAVFAFGKLMSADIAEAHLTELELWGVSQVYEWDRMTAIHGELSVSFVRPPDFVTLQSNLLFNRKQDMKQIVKTYTEGVPYSADIPASIPDGIASRLRDGSMSAQDVAGYYNSTVKGMFNGIYGTQAQDVYRPDYEVSDGLVSLDRGSVVTPDTFADRYADVYDKLVLYTYGMRIVGGSRVQLVLAMMALWDAFGPRARVLGGDTDSLKIAVPDDIGGADLLAALEPVHTGITSAIDACMERVRRAYPDHASPLTGVGCFEVEGDAYPLHMDAWNKARVSWDGEHAHITCAGLSRPKGRYTIEDWIDGAISRGYSFEELAPLVLGYNVTVRNGVCHYLERTHPAPDDYFDADVTDYLGSTEHVDVPASIALYPGDRVLGDIAKKTNARSAAYLETLGIDVSTCSVVVDVEDDSPVMWRESVDGWERVI